MKDLVLIYPLLQRNFAMLGYELIGSVSCGSSHHGAYSSSIRKFKVGEREFAGDYGTMRFTGKNCLLFRVIETT